MTTARHAVLDALMEKEDHLTAEEVYSKASKKYKRLGLATVYRTLELFNRLGMVSKFETGDEKARYEFSDSTAVKGHHHHMICVSCRKVFDYDDFMEEEKKLFGKIEENLFKKYGFKTNSHIIQFYGLCKNCSV
jgi:Fur family ferric uptake transcriptional regulator